MMLSSNPAYQNAVLAMLQPLARMSLPNHLVAMSQQIAQHLERGQRMLDADKPRIIPGLDHAMTRRQS